MEILHANPVIPVVHSRSRSVSELVHVQDISCLIKEKRLSSKLNMRNLTFFPIRLSKLKLFSVNTLESLA